MTRDNTLISDDEYDERERFLLRRQEGCGSSDTGKILVYGGALDVYHEKTRPVREEDIVGTEQSVNLLRGVLLEPIAVTLYLRLTGRVGRRERRTFKSTAYPGNQTHSDGTLFQGAVDVDGEPFDGPGNLEIKAPGVSTFANLVSFGTRPSTVLQLQHGCAVRRLKWGSFGFCNLEHSNGPLVPFDQPANAPLGEFLLEAMSRFWTEHVEPRNPPDPAEWTTLIEKAPPIPETGGGDKLLVDDDEVGEMIQTHRQASELEKRAEKTRREVGRSLDEWIAKNAKEQGKIEVAGVGRATRVRHKGRSSFDRLGMVASSPIDRDAFVRAVRDGDVSLGKDVDVEAIADGLRLDLERFDRQGTPYSYVLTKTFSGEKDDG